MRLQRRPQVVPEIQNFRSTDEWTVPEMIERLEIGFNLDQIRAAYCMHAA